MREGVTLICGEMNEMKRNTMVMTERSIRNKFLCIPNSVKDLIIIDKNYKRWLL